MDDLFERIAGLSPAKRALLELRLKQRTESAGPAQAIAPRSNRRSARASFAQQRLWFLHQLDPGLPFYNVSRAIRMTGFLDAAALTQTLRELVRRHETFRTRFVFTDGTLLQVVGGDVIALKEVDL